MQHQEDSGTFGGPEGVEIAPGVYQCEFPSCSKRFTTKFSLKRHYYIHSRKKTFPCSFCNKVFALPQYLREHQYTHTNQQPFVCGVDGCTESFRQRGKLSLHRRTHGNFKKKDYRLLNVALNRTVRRNQSDGHSHDSSDDERHIKDEDLQTIKEEIKEDDDQPKIESGKQRSIPTDQYNRESLNNVGAQSQKDKQLLYNNDQQNPHSIQIGPIQHHSEKYQASEQVNPQKHLQANEARPIANVSFGCNPSQMTPIYHQYSTTQQHQNVPVQFYQQYSMPNTQGHFVAPFLQSQIQEPYAIEQVATTFNPYNNSTLGGSTAITQNNQCLKEIPTNFELANESKTKCQINLRQGALENQGFPENIQSQGIESKNCQNYEMNQQRGQENVQGQNAIAFQEQIQKQTSPLQALKSQCNEGSSTSTITEPSRENHPTQPRERTSSPKTVQIEHQGEPEQRGASSDGIHNPPTAANGFVAPNPLVCNHSTIICLRISLRQAVVSSYQAIYPRADIMQRPL
ncbi:hypothetical protein FGO68_gene17806 [Halteria grandinella]|uniref:C2H2-type domain-containing protein n=1 Tax=Halteria grandinella TaxID=5974 RepID=A0A8J8NYS1_HALGN|nr:hypothetical protein FGO68_gene17806 [Halteria grandinella]